jgi:hypothetical protein
MQNHFTPVLLLAITTCALLLAGCGNPNVTRSNYSLIAVGMHYSEVRHMMGEPDWCDNDKSPSECRWGDEDKNIEVTFAARRVVDTRATGL